MLAREDKSYWVLHSRCNLRIKIDSGRQRYQKNTPSPVKTKESLILSSARPSNLYQPKRVSQFKTKSHREISKIYTSCRLRQCWGCWFFGRPTTAPNSENCRMTKLRMNIALCKLTELEQTLFWFDNLQNSIVVARWEGGRAEPSADIALELTSELD